jgi:hypothetical protein
MATAQKSRQAYLVASIFMWSNDPLKVTWNREMRHKNGKFNPPYTKCRSKYIELMWEICDQGLKSI